jgi:pimeloyl-ACP methyl ester carboxylesterase
MTRRGSFLPATLLSILLSTSVSTFGQNPAITTDPAPDKLNPASMHSFQLPSHGSLLNALVYLAAGAGPHPTVILLHGFPGNEKNLDLAQSIRRAGWNVLYFNYRGSWGSPGEFSFTHCIEDAQSAIAYLRDPVNAGKLRTDPKTIVLVGHSMGGFVAVEASALDPGIRAVAAISAADMDAGKMLAIPAEKRDLAVKNFAASLAEEGMAPLAGTSPESLAKEVMQNADKWAFLNIAPKLATRPLLVISADDGLAPTTDAFVEAVEKAGNQEVRAIHMATDHAYSDHRIVLQQAVLEGLDYLSGK